MFVFAEFLPYESGHAAVCQQHEFFYKFVGVFRFFEKHSDWFVVLVEIEFHFQLVERYGSVLQAARTQFFSHSVQSEYLVLQGAVAAFYHGLRFFVREAFVGAGDSAAEPFVEYACFLVHFKHSRECQLILVRAQGTYVVAQYFGQHGNDAVHKVHRSAAVVSLAVEVRTFFHVMRNVGDMYSYLVVAVFQKVYRQRVVEVLGIRRVYRKCGGCTHIAPPSYFLFAYFERQRSRFLFNFIGKFVRQTVFGQYRVYLHVVFAGTSQNVRDTPYGIGYFVRPFRYFDNYLVAVFHIA